MKRIILDQTDFEKLTRGEVIKKDDVEIALSDIGYNLMSQIVKENMYDSILKRDVSNSSESDIFWKDILSNFIKQERDYKKHEKN
jgi:hypothetical protein